MVRSAQNVYFEQLEKKAGIGILALTVSVAAKSPLPILAALLLTALERVQGAGTARPRRLPPSQLRGLVPREAWAGRGTAGG